MLHDSLASVGLWRGFPKLLAQQLSRRVIAYDRLGFGRSDARTAPPSLRFIEEEFASSFQRLKSALEITQYLLFGHSVGGAMSINIASQDRDCRGVVTVASQAFVEPITTQGIEVAKRGFQEPGQFERLEKWHGEKAKWVLRAWTDVWLSPDFASWSLAPYIGGVVCPVLAIHGDNDEYGSAAFPTFISERVSGYSKMVLLPDCGHMPHKEMPQEVLRTVQEFIANHCAEHFQSGHTVMP